MATETENTDQETPMLGFPLDLTSRQRRPSPNWNAYRSPSGVIPSLVLDFERQLYGLNGTRAALDALTTFTRAGTATHFDAQGILRTAAAGQPRIDHDPATGEVRGVLIEEERQNLVTHSADFTAWSAGANTVVTADAATSPDGAAVADRIGDNAAGGAGEVRVDQTAGGLTPGGTYTVSVFAKSAGIGGCAIRLSGASVPAPGSSAFDLGTGAVVSAGTGHAAAIRAVNNGWHHVSVTFTLGAQDSSVVLSLQASNPDGTTAVDLDGSSGILLWGAQLEQGPAPGSYIPTAAQPVTRPADVLLRNWGEDYNPGSGTLVVEVIAGVADAISALFAISDGTVANRIYCRASGYCSVIGGGSVQVSTNTGALPVGTASRIAFAVAQNDFAVARDGGPLATDTAGSMPVGITRLYVGQRFDGLNYGLNGHVRRLVYYPVRLPDADVQELSQA